MRCFVLLALVACHPEDPEQPLPSSGGDWVEVDLALPEHWSGLVSVWRARDLDSDQRWYLAGAQFLEPGPNAPLLSEVLVEDPVEGVQDCGRQRVTGQVEPPVGAARRSVLDAGSLSLTTPDGDTVPLQPYGDEHSADLGAAGLEPIAGVHVFSAPGGDLPAFALEVPLVPELQLLSPDPRQGLPVGQTEVVWTESSEGTVWFEVAVVQGSSMVMVSCMWEDDGADTIPAELLEGLPEEGLVVWSMSRRQTAEYELSDGSIVGGQSSSRLSYVGG